MPDDHTIDSEALVRALRARYIEKKGDPLKVDEVIDKHGYISETCDTLVEMVNALDQVLDSVKPMPDRYVATEIKATISDFYYHRTAQQFIYRPNGEMWPKEAVSSSN